MYKYRNAWLCSAAFAVAFGFATPGAKADEIIKYGFSSSMSGSAAIWGKAQAWLCNRAAQEIKDAGGIKVKDKVYNIECLVYDNKYNAGEATKVAQTLLNSEGVKFMYAAGTAPVLATQSLTERQGVLLFSVAVGPSARGPQFPLTFNTVATAYEVTPGMIKYVKATYPNARTIAMLDVGDATGREFDAAAIKMWEAAGYTILTSDHYERGTTEFQAIALRLMSYKPDIIDLPSMPPPDAGQVLKELGVLGFNGIKVLDTGGSADGLLATSGPAGEGTLMGEAITFDGPDVSAQDRKIAEDAKAYLGESLGIPMICAYDPVYALKAGIEKAQSLDPKEIAAVLPTVKFRTLLGGMAHFGGQATYGSDSQAITPIYITQIVNGKLVEKARIEPQ
jgi:branched-chain amino acid transport system substrate-binding protein